LIDGIVVEYGWTIEYVLEQPYTKLRELLNSMKFRKYIDTMRLFRLHNLAHGGDNRTVEKFFEDMKPSIPELLDKEVEETIVYAAMDLSGFNYTQK
jgi:hypothetical protein